MFDYDFEIRGRTMTWIYLTFCSANKRLYLLKFRSISYLQYTYSTCEFSIIVFNNAVLVFMKVYLCTSHLYLSYFNMIKSLRWATFRNMGVLSPLCMLFSRPFDLESSASYLYEEYTPPSSPEFQICISNSSAINNGIRPAVTTAQIHFTLTWPLLDHTDVRKKTTDPNHGKIT